MKKIIITINLIFILSSCNDISNYDFKYYNKGNIEEINIKKDYINECFDYVFDYYNLLIFNRDIEFIKKQGKGVEIIFDKNINYNFKKINKNKSFSRVFIPYSGKYKNILFLGDNEGYGAYTPFALKKICNFGLEKKEKIVDFKKNEKLNKN